MKKKRENLTHITTLRLAPGTTAQVSAEAKRLATTPSAIIRQALSRHLATRRPPIKK